MQLVWAALGIYGAVFFLLSDPPSWASNMALMLFACMAFIASRRG